MSELDDKPPEIPETTAQTDQDGDDSGSMPPPDSEVKPPNPDSAHETSAHEEHPPPATTTEESPQDSESTEDEPSAVSGNDVAPVNDELHNHTESHQSTESSATDDIDGMPPLPPETELLEPETTPTPEAGLEPAMEAQDPDVLAAETTEVGAAGPDYESTKGELTAEAGPKPADAEPGPKRDLEPKTTETAETKPTDGGPESDDTRLSDIGPVRHPARVPQENEDLLIGPEQGLQSRKSGTFEDTIAGEPGDPDSKYLWTIDDRGINIALENTRFDTPRGNIVHTNISSQAAIGGEAWFGPDDSVTINAGSGRFGDGAGISPAQWDAGAAYWRSLGYRVDQIPYGRRLP